MAGIFKFHNKLHSASHYTVSGYGVESGSDAIASGASPFYGIFYNTVTDQNRTYEIASNSYDWYRAYATLRAMSATWAPSDSLYQTVNALSAGWNLGYRGFLTFAPVSAGFVSAYTTVNSLSDLWYNQYTMYTNQAQQYTRAKTFAGTTLTVTVPPSTVAWNLQNNQVTFFAMSADTFFSNPTNMQSGGTYTLSISTNRSPVSAVFDTAYRLSGALRFTRTVLLSGIDKAILDFTSDGIMMFGNPSYYLE